MKTRVLVVGSLSVDFVMRVPRRPLKGETIAGFDFNIFVGGKGNNQALAAARAGAQVSMIGNVGEDTYGKRIADTLEESGVNTSFLMRDTTAGTGIANIYVDPEGDNSIVIVPQSNGKLSPEKLQLAESLFEQTAIVLVQLEIPLNTVEAALKLGRKHGATTVLNPAPAPPGGSLPPAILQNTDILVPNQSETQLLTGIEVIDQASAHNAALYLQQLGVKQIVITMGEQGAFVAESEAAPYLVPTFSVNTIDTTAAGDAFCGALCTQLANGQSLQSAVAFGCAAGALATTLAGAEPSLPSRTDIDTLCAQACKEQKV